MTGRGVSLLQGSSQRMQQRVGTDTRIGSTALVTGRQVLGVPQHARVVQGDPNRHRGPYAARPVADKRQALRSEPPEQIPLRIKVVAQFLDRVKPKLDQLYRLA